MFERMLNAGERKLTLRRLGAFALAFALHGCVLCVVLAASLVVVGAVQDADLVISVIQMDSLPPTTPPPPPPPASKGADRTPKVEPQLAPPGETTQPKEVRRINEEDLKNVGESDEASPDGHPDGVPGGRPGGVPGGVPWGDFRGVPGGPFGGSGLADRAPLIVAGDVRAPVAIDKPDPEYPETARRARVEGRVILEAIISEEGSVESVRILRSQALLDGAAIAAVKRWKYRPATLDGQPVRVRFTVVVIFRLE
jgi:protein TonB